MMLRLGALGLCLALALAAASCGKKKEDQASLNPPATESQMPSMDTSMASTDTAVAAAATGDNVGSYAKLDMASLTPEQKEKVTKRLIAENCTCGCVGDTIDKCLRTDPSCGVAVTLAMQVIDDVKAGK
jgi:selenophosphate synthase